MFITFVYVFKQITDAFHIINLKKTTVMKIFVVNQTGETLAICVDGNNTIEDLKTRIKDIEGTKSDQIYLIFGGRLLQDSHKISEYNI